MPEASQLSVRPAHVRTQIYSIFREALWISVLALFITVLLYLPDQIREVYRISISENGWVGYGLIAVPVLAISVIVAVGAKVVVTDCHDRLENPGRLVSWVADALPAALGAAPLLALAAGLFSALPSSVDSAALGASGPGNAGAATDAALKSLSAQLRAELGQLETLALVTLGIALAFLLVAYAVSRASSNAMERINDSYFRRWLLLPVSTTLIAAATMAFFFFPVPVASQLGVFGMLAVFMASIVGMTAHLTVLSREHRWPLVALPLSLAFGFSLFDLNDNHEVRRLPPSEITAPQATRPERAPHADEEFLAWLERRPNLASWVGTYPVYVIAAQGGGIYAAYHTAIFLARMQDVCPAFRNHLFAISSVSGGSLGAAIFTAALRTVEQQRNSSTAAPAVEASMPASATAATAASPCPTIGTWLERSGSDVASKPLETPGPHEAAVRRMLSADLLSPLVGATLFTDFTQRFLPYPFGALDRARALESSFEAAASPTRQAGGGPLAQSFLAHWRPAENLGPALLLNATDAATGKRVIIAPFAVRPSGSAHQPGGVAHFPFWRQTESGREIAEPIDIRLSTAAGMSARFPWMTPAATVTTTVIEGQSKRPVSVRLVDGGYVDNSGVETALDLLASLETMKEKVALVSGIGRRGDGPGLNPVKFHLIALSGGGYPLRTSYSLGETLEPIRALLATRTSRAYVALERARLELGQDTIASLSIGEERVIPVTAARLRVADLTSRYYELPLGWALGSRTRDIIERQSGRFWECELSERLEQRRISGSQADCIQLMVYHELTRTMDRAVASIDRSSRARASAKVDLRPGVRFDNQAFLACYGGTRARALTETQARALVGLLTIWDEHPEWSDDRWLTFMLAEVAHESGNFSIKEENLSYASAQRIFQIFPRYFRTEEEAAGYVKQPEKLGDKVYGDRFGNREPGDGFRYRGRGMVQLTGRENYRRYGRLVGEELEALPELLLDPAVGAKVAFAHVFPLGSVNRLARFFTPELDDWAGARRALTGGLSGLQDFLQRVKEFQPCVQQTKRQR